MNSQRMWLFGLSLYPKKEDEIALLFRELSVMAAAGIPVTEGLDTLISESSEGKAKQVLTALKHQLESKDDIETIKIKYPKYYNSTFLYILRNSEPGKDISLFLNTAADELERRFNLKKRIHAAVAYPVVVFIIAVIISVILLTFVIPVFKDMFSSFGSALPVPTRIVVSISEFMTGNGIFVLGAVIILIFIVLKFKRLLFSLLSFLPFVKNILTKISAIQFLSYLSILLRLKITAKEAVKYAALAIDNPTFAKKTGDMEPLLAKGGSLTEAMKQVSIFPPMVVQVVSVMEKTGEWDFILPKVSEYYSRDIEISLDTMMSAMDILFIFLLGIVIGGMVVAMYLPIFTMAGAIG